MTVPTESKIITDLVKYGYLPETPIDEALALGLGDNKILDAIDLYREFNQVPSHIDVPSMFSLPRCGHPDDPYKSVAERVGQGGNWPRCHGIGDFHCANVRILNNPPAHLARNNNFEEVLRRVTRANQEIGLQLYWGGIGSPIQDNKSGYQLTMQFVQTSSGWIGLAQVVSNQGCNATHWSRYLATYMRTTADDETVRRMWSVLILHELGHNMGTGHTSGGIMNPSIRSLPASWMNDILLPWLRSRYGGEPIPNIPDPEPPLIDPPGSDYGIYPPGWQH